MPGQIALTWMPRPGNSAFSASVIPTTPYLAAQYGAISATGISPAKDAVMMTAAGRPWVSIRGTNASMP